ncbi:hypothetical protein MMC25_007047 [Agyrium rufum]|nr:hypothetical protein [Agyrium rufum]
MNWFERLFLGDEELGKKYDDHKWTARPSTPRLGGSLSRGARLLRLRRKRVLLGIVVVVALYFFFRNIPTNLRPISERIDTRVPGQTYNGHPYSGHPVRGQGEPPSQGNGPPPREAGSRSEKHYFDGEVAFYWLSSSLYGIANTGGYRPVNKNVLFAAADLRAASRLIPMACEMSRWNRNTVHFAFMGRDEAMISEIQRLNGVGPECGISWHDARPTYSAYSTDRRMETGVMAAISHIHAYMHPQVIIVDDPAGEEQPFVKGMQQMSRELGIELIELPRDAASRMLWFTRLDSGSLKGWHRTYIDIVIEAPYESSGSLLRLVRSIEAADYFGARRPRLTIEIPDQLDPSTQNYLENLIWPPLDPKRGPHTSTVTLRRRIEPGIPRTAEEGAIRLVESFYPIRSKDAHVLFLSPQVELSPLYFHFLFYNLLEYKYSSYGSDSFEHSRLIGISLDLPAWHLNDTDPFYPPLSTFHQTALSTTDKPETCQFLWKAPNHHAVLYFGDKWRELHLFLSARIRARHLNPSFRPRTRVTSLHHPTWTEYLLELMRIRQYSVLYANLPSGLSLAIIHDELDRTPSEFTRPSVDPFVATWVSPSDAVFDLPPSNPELPLLTSPLLSVLPNAGDLAELGSLAYLTHDGEEQSFYAAQSAAESFADAFRREIGGCRKKQDPFSLVTSDVVDLFCWDEMQDSDDENEDDDTQEEDKELPASLWYGDAATEGQKVKNPHHVIAGGYRAQHTDADEADIAVAAAKRNRKPKAIGPDAETKVVRREFEEHMRRQDRFEEGKREG